MMRTALRAAAPILPYLAVAVGLYAFHNAWVTLLGYHVGMIVVLAAAGHLGEAGQLLKLRRLPLALLAVLFGAIGGVLLYLLWPILGIRLDFGAALGRLGLAGKSWLVFILYFSLVNPWLEELYWRSYLGSPGKSVILNDLLFSGYHLGVLALFVSIPWLLAVFLILSGSAWLWRQFARLSDGLLLPVLSHMAADLTLILVIYHYSVVFL